MRPKIWSTFQLSLTCQNRLCISKLISESKLYQLNHNLILFTIITEKVTINRVMQISWFWFFSPVLWLITCFSRFCLCLLCIFSAWPRSAEYTIGICFETAKNTKVFECFFTEFQHSLWNFSTTGNLYSLKSWLWLAAVACVVRWPISNALLNNIWLTCFTRMCNWNCEHKPRVLWLTG